MVKRAYRARTCSSFGMRSSMACTGLYLAVEDFRIWLPLDVEDTDESPLGPRQRVIDEGIVAGEVHLEFGDDGAAGGDCHGLDSLERVARHATEIVDLVEYLADDM